MSVGMGATLNTVLCVNVASDAVPSVIASARLTRRWSRISLGAVRQGNLDAADADDRIGHSPYVHLLAHERDAFFFIGDDAQAVTQLSAEVQYRLSGADYRKANQISR